MPDSKKVIYAIERCTCHVPDACRDCPYDAGHPYNECIEMLLKDAAELLKEQEPVKPVKTWNTYLCGNCNRNVYHEERQGCLVLYEERYTYCPNCGRAVKWDDQ